ncbi:MAG: adenine deaminase [Candidatus Marinimicrobia bacterium]|nr:adenine deaminase [Candidatus Neomarinimicrobiota bacterium]
MIKKSIVSGKIVDVINRRIFSGEIHVLDGVIKRVEETDSVDNQYILPGFIDGHIHIESSMLVPSEFARIASVHGTVAAVSDPHEIANILGISGVEFMIKNASTVPFKFYFGAPACVPATPFETAGAAINHKDMEVLFQMDDILYLSEMMNVPGVLNDAQSEMEKLNLARKYGKKVDGHSPGLRGKDAEKYVRSGITTDHECVTIEEAREKIRYGMTIQIREGSAARNLDDLMPLIDEHPKKVMFCSDDRHPDDLVESHVRHMALRAKKAGHDLFNILQAACATAVEHYGLDVGLLQKGDSADFIIVDNLDEMNILFTFVNGIKIADINGPLLSTQTVEKINVFNAAKKSVNEFSVITGQGKIRVINVIDGQLITKLSLEIPKVENDFAIQDIERDLLKITVVNRYKNEKPAVAFIRNFGLKSGAIASSVAHDSHNIIAVGATDEDLCKAVNLVIKHKGGVCVVNGNNENMIPLPIAGIMSDGNGYDVAKQYAELDQLAKDMGSTLNAPFMTLSFMALLVIPELKLSDQGLFDGKVFKFTPLFTG